MVKWSNGQIITIKGRKVEQSLEEIRTAQKASWNKFSSGWKKWDEFTMEFLRPYGDEIIRQLQLKPTDVVLDVAAGTGEPGLTIASIVSEGKVVITDLAEDMLAVGREKAEENGITNVEFNACDVTVLPYADNTFDAISCRMGFMFFPDMQLAANEMVRVLKPGGRIAASVWCGPERNFWITATMGAVNKNIDVPKPPPGSPGMFRCAEDGLIRDIFAKAGLADIAQVEIDSLMHCKTTDVYWDFMTSVVAPVVGALNNADDATKENVKRDALDAVNQRHAEGEVSVENGARIISGVKV